MYFLGLMNDISPSLKCAHSEVPQPSAPHLCTQLYTLKLLSPQSVEKAGRCRIVHILGSHPYPSLFLTPGDFLASLLKKTLLSKLILFRFCPEYLVLICQISKTKTIVKIWGGEDYFIQYTNVNSK